MSIPCEVQIWSSVQVQFIFEHLMDGFGGCALLRNPEFGDLLLAGIAG